MPRQPIYDPPPDTAPPAYWRRARSHLRRRDPVLATVIGLAPRGSALRPRPDPFYSLARAIVGQQISVMAAESVWRKLIERIDAVTPAAFGRCTEDDFRSCGLSRQKITYLQSLAEHFADHSIGQDTWSDMADDDIIARLVQVKGIGQWTAEMFLIFHLQRPDVLPVGDLGVQKAIANHYTNGVRPGAAEMRQIAAPWRPWRSVAVWYLWRSLDAVPVAY